LGCSPQLLQYFLCIYPSLRYNLSPAVVLNVNKAFAEVVAFGMSKSPKVLPSEYIYDDKGTALFEKIMELEEYYPTNSEKNIINTRASKLTSLLIGKIPTLQLVELGPGNGEKIAPLLKELSMNCEALQYFPIDVSSKAIELLLHNLEEIMPQSATFEILPINDSYLSGLKQIPSRSGASMAVLLLGGNIGNFDLAERIDFLKEIADQLKKGDRMCIGFDLVKSFRQIQQAYDDSQGVTEAFNKNILQRINAELEGDFDLDSFEFYSTYNPFLQVVQSFLVSRKRQEVTIPGINQTYLFEIGDFIHTENSFKFTVPQIEELAKKTGFQVIEVLNDDNHWFADVIWEKL